MKQKYKNFLDDILKFVSFIASITTIIGVIVGTTYIRQIVNTSATANNNNNINIGTQQTTMSDDLYTAQNYFNQEMYESAMKLYQKWKGTSSIANLYIGYMYSNGLGVKSDFDNACTHYKNAYLLGEEQGLINYLYINLARPESYKKTIAALRFGYEQNNENTIRFLSLLISDKMLSGCDDKQKNNAKIFWELSESEQIQKMDQYLIEKTEYIENIEADDLPQNTDFTVYGKVLYDGKERLHKAIAEYVEFYEKETQEFYWEPVYEVKYSYGKTFKRFIYADMLFSEEIICF